MKSISKIVILLLVLLINNTSLAIEKINLSIQEINSDYGIKAWLAEDNSTPIISMLISFKHAGYAYDKIPGISAMATQLLKEGSKEYNAENIADILEKNGIILNFDTSLEYFTIHIKSLSSHFETALHLLKSILIHPNFDEKAFERIKTRNLTLIQKSLEDPNYLGRRKFFEIAFKDHPYIKPKYGTIKSVESITKKDIETYLSRVFNRVNLTISISGNIKSDNLSKMLDEYFIDLPLTSKETIEVSNLSKLNIPSDNIINTPMNIPQTVIYFGTYGIDIHAPEFYPAYVINYILGGSGLESILMDEVRKKKGLTYGIYTNLEHYPHANILLGFTATDYTKTNDVITSINQVFDAVKRDGITLEKLQNAKSYITNAFMMNLNNNDSIASILSYAQNNKLGTNYINDFIENIQKVKLQDINKINSKILENKKLLFITVGQSK